MGLNIHHGFLDNGMDSQLRPSFWKDVIAYLGPCSNGWRHDVDE